MADREFFVEGVQVYETGSEEWFVEGVQIHEDQTDTATFKAAWARNKNQLIGGGVG